VPGTHEAWYCPEDARDVLRRLREPEDQQARPLERFVVRNVMGSARVLILLQ
jgi:hypothetical protein